MYINVCVCVNVVSAQCNPAEVSIITPPHRPITPTRTSSEQINSELIMTGRRNMKTMLALLESDMPFDHTEGVFGNRYEGTWGTDFRGVE
jgi:hypothetical protein